MINSKGIRKQGDIDKTKEVDRAKTNQNLVTRLRLSLYIVSRKGFSLGWPT